MRNKNNGSGMPVSEQQYLQGLLASGAVMVPSCWAPPSGFQDFFPVLRTRIGVHECVKHEVTCNSSAQCTCFVAVKGVRYSALHVCLPTCLPAFSPCFLLSFRDSRVQQANMGFPKAPGIRQESNNGGGG